MVDVKISALSTGSDLDPNDLTAAVDVSDVSQGATGSTKKYPYSLVRDFVSRPNINLQTGTSYTLNPSDSGSLIICDSGSAFTLTVPTSLGVGFKCEVIQMGAGQVTFDPVGVTLHSITDEFGTSGQFASVVIRSYQTETYLLTGDLAAGSSPTSSVIGIGPAFGETITDGASQVWEIRLSDRTVLKDSVAQTQTNVQELWYSEGIVWAFYGDSWEAISGTSGLTVPVLDTTPGLRRSVGPKVLNFTPTGTGAVTLFPGSATSGAVLGSGNLQLTAGSTVGFYNARGTVAITGKKFFSVTVGTSAGAQNMAIGVANALAPNTNYLGSDGNARALYDSDVVVFGGGSTTPPGTFGYTSGDVIDVCIDVTNSLMGWRKNGGAWEPNSYDPVAATGGQAISVVGPIYPAVQSGKTASVTESLTCNFGATSYTFAPPTGFTSLAGTSGVAEGVALFPGDDVQSVINANPAGSTFCFTKGTYAQQSLVPRDGDVYLGEFDGTTGATLDGQSTTAHAFSGTAVNVTIANLFIKSYASATQDATVKVLGSYCFIRACDISLCTTGGGLWLADHCLALDSVIHNNGQLGYKAAKSDTAGDVAVGIVFDNCEIHHNNPTNAGWDGGEEGGGKSVWTDRMWHLYCYTHDNGGPGFWQDIDNIDTYIWYCNCSNNLTEGIAHEISWNASFIGNFCANNGSPASASAYVAGNGIGIQNSGGVPTGHSRTGIIEIANNTIVSGPNGRACCFRQQDRGSSTNPYASGVNWVCQNISVHDNTFDLSGGMADTQMGMAADFGDGLTTYYSRNLTWDNNHYTLGSNGYFCWADATTGAEYAFYNFTQWQGLGNDVHGDAH
jgi:hypothetical protein